MPDTKLIPSKNKLDITIIAARSRNGIIGNNNSIPWKLKHDLIHFKKLTIHNVVIMGRKTFDSMNNNPLPNRINIVITRDKNFTAPFGTLIFNSIEQALEHCELFLRRLKIFIIGGGEIYLQTINLANKLVITEVDTEIEGDTKFPTFSESDFIPTFIKRFPESEVDEYSFWIVTYRKSAF